MDFMNRPKTIDLLTHMVEYENTTMPLNYVLLELLSQGGGEVYAYTRLDSGLFEDKISTKRPILVSFMAAENGRVTANADVITDTITNKNTSLSFSLLAPLNDAYVFARAFIHIFNNSGGAETIRVALHVEPVEITAV